MAENIPPSTSTAQPSHAPTTTTAGTRTAGGGDDRGRPYYESLRTTLRSTLEKKRKLDEQLAAIEDSIFKAEGTYLEDTAGSGNIVRGFDGWVKGVQVSTGGRAGGGGAGGALDDRRRGGRVREEDRVFSRSSVGWMKAQDGTDSNTPSTAPTPSATAGSAREGATPAASGTKSLNKKKRPVADKDEDEDGKGVKRGKISYARD